jgi:hypothetical protein
VSSAAVSLRRAAPAAERAVSGRVGDHGDPQLGASLNEAAAHRAVVEHAERDLHRGDRGERDRLLELRPVDVRDAHLPHEPLIPEAGERAQRCRPGRARIGGVNEVGVDGQSVERGEACVAVGADRLGAAIRHPCAVRSRHASLGDDARSLGGAGLAHRARQQTLAVAIRPSGVEHGDPGLERGRDRLRGLQAHASEADAKLGRLKPGGHAPAAALANAAVSEPHTATANSITSRSEPTPPALGARVLGDDAKRASALSRVSAKYWRIASMPSSRSR